MAQKYEFKGNAYRHGAELNEWAKKREEPALEPELPIIDPHHHVWDDERGRYLIHELAEDVVGTGHNVARDGLHRSGLDVSQGRAGGDEAGRRSRVRERHRRDERERALRQGEALRTASSVTRT